MFSDLDADVHSKIAEVVIRKKACRYVPITCGDMDSPDTDARLLLNNRGVGSVFQPPGMYAVTKHFEGVVASGRLFVTRTKIGSGHAENVIMKASMGIPGSNPGNEWKGDFQRAMEMAGIHKSTELTWYSERDEDGGPLNRHRVLLMPYGEQVLASDAACTRDIVHRPSPSSSGFYRIGKEDKRAWVGLSSADVQWNPSSSLPDDILPVDSAAQFFMPIAESSVEATTATIVVARLSKTITLSARVRFIASFPMMSRLDPRFMSPSGSWYTTSRILLFAKATLLNEMGAREDLSTPIKPRESVPVTSRWIIDRTITEFFEQRFGEAVGHDDTPYLVCASRANTSTPYTNERVQAEQHGGVFKRIRSQKKDDQIPTWSDLFS